METLKKVKRKKISFHGLIGRLDTKKEIIRKPEETLPVFLIPKPIFPSLQRTILLPWNSSSPLCRLSSLYSRIRSSPMASCAIYMSTKSKFQLPAQTSLSSRLDNPIWMSNRYLKMNTAKMEFLISLSLLHLSLNLFFSQPSPSYLITRILFNSST